MQTALPVAEIAPAVDGRAVAQAYSLDRTHCFRGNDSGYHMTGLRDRVRDIMQAAIADESLDPADRATLASITAGASENDIGALLDEFFDVEVLAVILFDHFQADGAQWNETTRRKLTESLVFHGLDQQASTVLATMKHD